MTDKIPVIVQSVNDTNGEKSVIQTALDAGAAVPPHYHTLLTKLFKCRRGEINVWNGDAKTVLTEGQSVTVERGEIHRYQVSSKPHLIKLTFRPGNLNFEKAVKVITGAQTDKAYTRLSTAEDTNLTGMAVIADLTDSYFTGETGKALIEFLQTNEGKRTEKIKNEWIKKYHDAAF